MKASSNFGTCTLRKYTVCGNYMEGDAPCCFHVEAPDACEAVSAARLVAGHDFRLAEVFSGHAYPLTLDGNDRPKHAEVLS